MIARYQNNSAATAPRGISPSDGVRDIGADAIACPCLRITEAAVLAAIADRGVKTLDELTRETGAGSACTACHRRLRKYVPHPSSGV